MGASTADNPWGRHRKRWWLVSATPFLILIVNFYGWVATAVTYYPGQHEMAVLGVAMFELALETPVILLCAFGQRRHQRKEEAKEWFYPQRIKHLSAIGWALLQAGIGMNAISALVQAVPGVFDVLANITPWLQVAAGITTAVAIGLHAEYL